MPKMTEDEWIEHHLARSPEPTREQLEATARILRRHRDPEDEFDPTGVLRAGEREIRRRFAASLLEAAQQAGMLVSPEADDRDD